MTAWAREAIDRLEDALEPAADPVRAPAMAAYMKGHFPFLGIPAPRLRQVSKVALAPLGKPSPDDALAAAELCWQGDAREFQYVGCDLLSAVEKRLDPGALEHLAGLITTKSWWDTVDLLAGHPVCSILVRHPDQRPVMDRWLASDDMWLARSAILHQLHAREATDPAWLFAACAARAEDREFFIRKAIGWALRSYAHRGPAQADAVRRFVAEHDARLSGLSKREALKRVRH